MKRVLLVPLAWTTLLMACNEQGDSARKSEVLPSTLKTAMTNVVDPQAQILWNASNKTYKEDGSTDPTRLSEADWMAVLGAGEKLQAQANAWASTRIVVAAPREKIRDEGNPGASNSMQVQKYIDADRQGFSAFAKLLAANAAQFVAASKRRDAAKLAEASGELEELCEACHREFWYPQLASQ